MSALLQDVAFVVDAPYYCALPKKVAAEYAADQQYKQVLIMKTAVRDGVGRVDDEAHPGALPTLESVLKEQAGVAAITLEAVGNGIAVAVRRQRGRLLSSVQANAGARARRTPLCRVPVPIPACAHPRRAVDVRESTDYAR